MNWFAILILVVMCLTVVYLLYSVIKVIHEKHLIQLIKEKGFKNLVRERFHKNNKEGE